MSMAIQIFVGEPFNEYSLAKQKYINNNSIYVISADKFIYYIRTQNGIVSSVSAVSSRTLAPVQDFIKDANLCSKSLIMRIPLRMAEYQYSCPSGNYIYQTFGAPGRLQTNVWIKSKN